MFRLGLHSRDCWSAESVEIVAIGVLEKMRKEEKAQFEVTLSDVTKTVAAVVKAIEILHGHQATDFKER